MSAGPADPGVPMREIPPGHEAHEDAAPPQLAQSQQHLRSQPRWMTIAAVAGGLVTTVTATALVTLALTHRTAVRQNAAAYVNGRQDGYAQGFVDSRAMLWD